MPSASRRLACPAVVLFAQLLTNQHLAGEEPQPESGVLAAGETWSSTPRLKTGDLLLVSIDPISKVQLILRGPDDTRLKGVSFEHAGWIKRYAFAARLDGKHRLEIRPRSNVESTRYRVRSEVVSHQKIPKERLERLLTFWHSSSNPGGTVAVTHNGETAFVGSFGSANLEARTDVRPDTVLDTASLAKHVTAVCIATLANSEKLSLDDDVRKYLPEVPQFGKTITLRHLLYHTSGLRDFLGLMVLGNWHDYDIVTLPQVLELVRKQTALNFEPGSEFSYSNTGYSLLAEVISRVTGQPLSEWAEENLFQPLGMKNSLFLENFQQIVPRRSQAYTLLASGHLRGEPNNLVAMGSSSFLTTGEDVARWLVNLDTKTTAGKAIEELLTVHGRLASGKSLDYGLGIAHGHHGGSPSLEHSGSFGGFRSHLMHLPKQRFSVAVLSNQGNFDPASLTRFVARLFVGEELQDKPRSTRETTPLEAAPDAVAIDRETLDTYVGAYEIQPGEIIEVTRKDDHLELRPKGHPVPPIIAKALSRTRFTGPPNGSIEFVADAAGNVVKGVIRNGDQVVGEAKRLKGSDKAAPDLQTYEAQYLSHELGAVHELLVQNGKLIAKSAKRTRQLSFVADDKFLSDDGIDIEFVRNSDGKIVGFEATLHPRVRNVLFERR